MNRQDEIWIINKESKEKKKSRSNPESVLSFFSKWDGLDLILKTLNILTSFVNLSNLVIRPSLIILAKLLYYGKFSINTSTGTVEITSIGNQPKK